MQFSNGRVAPEGARIVYIDGAFDCFHPGHVKILQAGGASAGASTSKMTNYLSLTVVLGVKRGGMVAGMREFGGVTVAW